MNGLLRQCFPKRTDLSVHGPNMLRAVEDRLNNRPRKTLGGRHRLKSSIPSFDDQASVLRRSLESALEHKCRQVVSYQLPLTFIVRTADLYEMSG